MRLKFLGSGDAFGSGGRFNTCLHVTTADTTLLIDCGASSMVAIRRFGIDPNALDLILVTHLHGDHFGGLPFLLLDAQLVSRRTRPLILAGPPGFALRLREARENFFPGSTTIEPRYKLEILELPAERPAVFGPVRVTPYVVKHYCGAPPYALRVEAEGKVLAYTGDTEWVDALVPAARDADLLVAEAYFFDKKIKYHLDYKTLESRLADLNCRRVVLTHMSADMLQHVGRVACDVAEDGKEFTI